MIQKYHRLRKNRTIIRIEVTIKRCTNTNRISGASLSLGA